MPEPLLSVIVVAHGAPEALLQTLQSVYTQTKMYTFEVFVVDTGDAEARVREVVEVFPARYIPMPNRGFAAAINAGICQTTAPFLVLLNPDVVLHDDALSELATQLVHNQGIGCVAPVLLKPDGHVQPYAFGEEPAPLFLLWRGLMRMLGQTALVDHSRVPNEAVDVGWVAGTCLATRRSVVQSVGLLDESFFLYWEDIDWCMRVRRHGLRVVLDARIRVTHLGGASVGRTAPDHYYRSMIRFYRKWYGTPAACLLAIFLKLYAPLSAAIRRNHARRV